MEGGGKDGGEDGKKEKERKKAIRGGKHKEVKKNK